MTFFEPDMLKLSFLAAEKSGADICVFDADFYNNKTKLYKGHTIDFDLCPDFSVFDKNDLGQNLWNFTKLVVWSKLYRHSFLEENHLEFQNLTSCNDTAFGYLTFACAKTFVLVPKILTHYRIVHQSVISSKRGARSINVIKAWMHVKEELVKRNLKHLLPMLNQSFENRISYEISCCSIKQFQLFKKEAKNLLKRDFKIFSKLFDNCLENINEDIIVSLTSYNNPNRINSVFLVIKSLLEQSIEPDKIILYLGEDQFPLREADLPENLTHLQNEIFEIRFIKKDLRSFTKLAPALKDFPNAVIVTADDDIIYPKSWLRRLLEGYAKDKKSIHCHRIHHIKFKNKKIAPYDSWQKEVVNNKPSFLNFLTGVGGVLYPPKSLHPEVLNLRKAFELCPYADDIWFWAMAVKNQTKIRGVENQILSLNYVPYSQDGDCLLKINNGQNKNDAQIQNILSQYPELYSIIDI